MSKLILNDIFMQIYHNISDTLYPVSIRKMFAGEGVFFVYFSMVETFKKIIFFYSEIMTISKFCSILCLWYINLL